MFLSFFCDYNRPYIIDCSILHRAKGSNGKICRLYNLERKEIANSDKRLSLNRKKTGDADIIVIIILKVNNYLFIIFYLSPLFSFLVNIVEIHEL